jgi:TetR/AcrR family transcriptional regulator
MEDTREKILDAALEAFVTGGYARTTMDEIAGRAGVAKGTLYWHFKGKEQILFAGIDRETSRVESVASRILRLEDPSVETLEALFDVKTWINDDMRRFHKVMLSVWTDVSSGVRRKIEERMKEDHERFVGIITRFLDGIRKEGCVPGVRNRALGALIHATMSGVFMHMLTGGDTVDLDEMSTAMKQVYVKRILDGVAAQ